MKMLGVSSLEALARRHWYQACALVIVGAFAALALLWTGLVPMFQSPDEPEHFAYAWAMARAERLIRPADGPPGLTNDVETAMRASGMGRIAFDASEPAPPDYGTDAFFARVRDAVAQAGPPEDPGAPGTLKPSLASVYPFFGYLPDAIVMLAFRDDLVGALFAARTAHVAYGALTLLLWAAILPRIGIPRVLALAVLTLVACSPLTSFVSSYIQPDGISALLTATVLLFALRIRDGATTVTDAIAYGVALGLLYATKTQFALAVGLGSALTVAPALLRSPRPAVRVLCALAPLVVSAALVSALMTGARAPNYYHGSRTILGGVRDHSGNLHALLTYLGRGFTAACGDFFFGGTTARSWWGVFGWLDTPNHIIDDRWTTIFARAETVGTAAVMALLAAALARSAWRRMGEIRGRRWRCALEHATRDPVLTSYVIYAGLLVGLYVASDNLFGAQGRNWYPFECAAVLVAVRYAPAALGGRLKTTVASLFGLGLALNATVGAQSAVRSLEARYYGYPVFDAVAGGPRRPSDVARLPLAGTPLSTIDIAYTGTGDQLVAPFTAHVRPGEKIEIFGWAIDTAARTPCSATYAMVDGRFGAWSRDHLARPDVSRALREPNVEQSGFRVTLSFPSRGTYRISIGCVSADGASRVPLAAGGTVIVAS